MRSFWPWVRKKAVPNERFPIRITVLNEWDELLWEHVAHVREGDSVNLCMPGARKVVAENAREKGGL